MPTPTFRDVLKQAAPWRAENTPADLERARVLLVKGMEEYDDALPLGDELVLVLKQLGRLDEAIALLGTLEQRFKDIGEETLCRWGSVYKKRARQSIDANAFGEALHFLQESERFYARAFEEHHTFYPRINQLTVRFVRAALAKKLDDHSTAAALLRTVQADAEAMIVDPQVWSMRKLDDHIWRAASRGEACVLLQRWRDAEAAYAEALQSAAGQDFYPGCMHEQLRLVLIPAFAWLSIPFEGSLGDPEKFFGRPAPAVGKAGPP